MSAIFGILHLDEKPIDPVDLDRMARSLQVHGPDGGAVWRAGNVGLGQRLTRLTPEDCFEQQPLVSSDGRRILVCASRLDNRPELLRELGPWPAPADELPDSALVLRSIERWGLEAPSHLIGDFAFAGWNKQERLLTLARSPLGVHPLHYHSSGNLLAFSSLPKGLFALPGVPREINPERVADFLTSVPGDPGSSFYRGIQALEAGHCLLIERGGLQVRSFWDLRSQREGSAIAGSDCVEAVRSLLDRAVSDRLRCVSPVGLMMSGGLDSTSVAASAITSLSPSNTRLATFTEVPSANFSGSISRGRYADESSMVEAMQARYPRLELNLIRTDGRTFLGGLSTFFRVAEEPFPNASNRMWFEAILEACQQRGLRAILTGASGNLTISWSGRGLLPQLLRTGHWGRALHEAGELHRRSDARPAWRILAAQGLVPLLPAPIFGFIERARNGNAAASSTEPWLDSSAIRPDFARSQRVAGRAEAKNHHFQPTPVSDFRRSRYQAMQRINSGLGCIATGYLSLFGVELRDPTADLRLTEFCLGLPEDQFMRDGVTRSLIRRAMASRLPEKILSQQDRGLQAADWLDRFTAERAIILNELDLQQRSALASAALDLPRVRQLVEGLPKYAADNKNVLRNVRGLLDKALTGGRFLRWFESGE